MKKKETVQIEMVANGFTIRPGYNPRNENIAYIDGQGTYVFNELGGNALGSPSVFEFLESHFKDDEKAKGGGE